MLAGWMDRFAQRATARMEAVAAVVPHGSFLLSGAVAGSVYSRVERPAAVILLGASHVELEKPVNLMRRGHWITPLGQMRIDEDLADLIHTAVPEAKEDSSVFAQEHSIEVQLPFLQRLWGLERFVPMVIAAASREVLEELGMVLSEAVRRSGKKVTLVISANLSRSEPQETVRVNDQRVIEQLLRLDETGLLETVKRHSISMCGVEAAAVGLIAAKHLGARRATQTLYQSSVDVVGNQLPASGYAGIVIE